MALLMPSVFLFLIFGVIAVPAKQNEAKLLNDLFAGYNKLVRPGGDEAVTVKHEYKLNRVIDFDVEHQVLALDVWESQKWTDERLQWDKDQYHADKIRVPAEMLWMPDLAIYNSAGSVVEKYQRVFVLVYNDGRCYHIPAYEIRIPCEVSDHIAAGDHVTCNITMGSWTHSADDLSLQEMQPGKPDRERFMPDFIDLNRYWEVEAMHAIRNTATYECCPEEYVSLVYSIVLKRKNHL